MIDIKKIQLIPADKTNESHKRGVLKVLNENIEFSYLTKEPISYEDHTKWWDKAFDKEFIYILLYDANVIGYIRLTKSKTESKVMNEISIALLKKFQKSGVGSQAYKLFETEMKKLGIKEIIAHTNIQNTLGQRFFEKNKFEKILIRYRKIIKN